MNALLYALAAMMHVAAATIAWTISPWLGLLYIAAVILGIWKAKDEIIVEVLSQDKRRRW